MNREISFKIPGKVIISGSYIVTRGETGVSVNVDRYLRVKAIQTISESFSITINIKKKENLTCTYKNGFVCDDPNSKKFYVFKIIEVFYSIANITPTNNLQIFMEFDNGFFIEDLEKTGIGSSACGTIGLLYCLLYFNMETLISQVDKIKLLDSPVMDSPLLGKVQGCCKLQPDVIQLLNKFLYTINKKLFPLASGSDVFSCLFGLIRFSSTSVSSFKLPGKYLVLGTFGQSTSTRSMFDKVDLSDSRWDCVKELNRKLLNSPSKRLYEEYLDCLHNLSKSIVPQRQYEILKSTFNLNVIGCGISGSGGEDAVWCIVDDLKELVNLWTTNFNHVIITELVEEELMVDTMDFNGK